MDSWYSGDMGPRHTPRLKKDRLRLRRTGRITKIDDNEHALHQISKRSSAEFFPAAATHSYLIPRS